MSDATYLTYFRALCAIPHPSGNTDAISDFCMSFAASRGLECHKDDHNNVVIRKPASTGYEDHPPVVLQGHLDMVAEADADSPVDPNTEPLRLCFDGDYLFAKGTTLGGDDGIAVAFALAILDDDSIPHPPLEALFTTDEEIGMIGAAELDPAMVRGRTFINLDSEEEGTLLTGCAGGAHAAIRLPLTRTAHSGRLCRVEVTGLPGGHSGTEIHVGHANADILLLDVLKRLASLPGFALVSMAGGQKDNAIPREASAEILLNDGDGDGASAGASASLSDLLSRLEAEARALYPVDPDLTLTCRVLEPITDCPCLADESLGRVLSFFDQAPCGVVAMSPFDPALVQTSLNLGIMTTEADRLCLTYSVRSSVNAEREGLLEVLANCTAEADGQMQIGGQYPAWEYKSDSRLREVMVRVFEQCYGHKPIVNTIHAGLECGLFCGMFEGLDCVSCGPDILDIHTPRERLSLSSVARTWAYLLAVLKEL